MGQKQDRKYQHQEMSTFFFAFDFVLESLQRSRLYVNNKKSSITRENAFLNQIEHSYLVKSNIHCIKRKNYSYATKTDSELRENHFFAVTTFRNYCKQLNCMEMTKECPESKDKHFYARSYLSTQF